MDLSKILCDPLSPASSSTSPLLPATTVDEVLTPARRKSFFKMSHGRQLSALAKYYPLPVDEEEIRVGVIPLKFRRSSLTVVIPAHEQGAHAPQVGLSEKLCRSRTASPFAFSSPTATYIGLRNRQRHMVRSHRTLLVVSH